MQTLLDFLPVAAFVVTYWITGEFSLAISVIMAAVVIQVAITWLMTRTVHRVLLLSAGLIVVLGGVSLWLNNPLVFKWKPTALYWLFSAAFLGSQFIGKKTLVQRFLQSVSKEELQLTAQDWVYLNVMWVAFFFVAGTANIVVAYNFEEAIWVNFKLFGLIGLTMAFMVLQAFWITRRLPAEHNDSNPGQ